jgi:hypothetical protein
MAQRHNGLITLNIRKNIKKNLSFNAVEQLCPSVVMPFSGCKNINKNEI